MKRVLAVALGLALASAAPMLAEGEPSCPPADLDQALPGAMGITFQEANVSTARYPGRWQEGRYGEANIGYRLFVDGTGTVSNDLRRRGWHVDFACDLQAKTCTFKSMASPPEAAVKAAKAIGACLTAKPAEPKKAKAEPAKAEKPKEEVAAVKVAQIKDLTVSPADPKQAPAKPAAASANAGKPAAKDNQKTRSGDKGTKTAGPSGTSSIAATKAPTGAVAAGRTRNSASLGGSAWNGMPLPVPRRTNSTPYPQGKETYACTGSPPPARPADWAPAAQISPANGLCWTALLPNEPQAARIQRMLLLAGYDAGPIDGAIGKRTQSALASALGATAKASNGEVLDKLENLLCASRVTR
jgi:hypothetical protein